MSTHAAYAIAVERALRQTDIIHADMSTIDSEPQSLSLELPPEDMARWPLVSIAAPAE